MFHPVLLQCKLSGIQSVYTFHGNRNEMATDFEIKNAKPKEKDYTINVVEGLSVLVKKTGSKLWRYRYSYANKRCMISLGKYPQITLKQAKSKHRQYLDMLEDGVNPSTHKHIQKHNLSSERTLTEVAKEWYKKRYKTGHFKESRMVLGRLERYIYPVLGKLPIKQIEPPMLFNMIEAIQEQGKIETGKRVNSYCSMIFRFGVAKGYCDRDMTQDYRGMLKSKKPEHMPTLTEPDEIGEFLNDIENHQGTHQVKYALKISAYIFTRPSELAKSKWEYIDFEKSHWIIPAEHMKMKRDHLIPFPKQVKKLLQLLLPITGHNTYIFPSDKPHDIDQPMHSETVNKAIRRLEGGKYVGRIVSHGFRGMAVNARVNPPLFAAD